MLHLAANGEVRDFFQFSLADDGEVRENSPHHLAGDGEVMGSSPDHLADEGKVMGFFPNGPELTLSVFACGLAVSRKVVLLVRLDLGHGGESV